MGPYPWIHTRGSIPVVGHTRGSIPVVGSYPWLGHTRGSIPVDPVVIHTRGHPYPWSSIPVYSTRDLAIPVYSTRDLAIPGFELNLVVFFTSFELNLVVFFTNFEVFLHSLGPGKGLRPSVMKKTLKCTLLRYHTGHLARAQRIQENR